MLVYSHGLWHVFPALFVLRGTMYSLDEAHATYAYYWSKLVLKGSYIKKQYALSFRLIL